MKSDSINAQPTNYGVPGASEDAADWGAVAQ